MKQKVRVGVIGTSGWADMLHLPSLAADSRVELPALCGRDRPRAEQMATKYRVGAVFRDDREMLGRGSLDAVVIVTRTMSTMPPATSLRS
jgi:predicted dehydrogenase